MQKERKSRAFCKLFAIALSVAITSQSFSQENNNVTISSDVAKQMNKKFDALTIYKVEQKQVQEYVYKDELTKINTSYLTNSMDEKLPSVTAKYQQHLQYVKTKKIVIESIKNKLNEYLLSQEKPKNKQQYLIDAQNIADENDVEIVIKQIEKINTGLRHRPFNPYTAQHQAFLEKIQAQIGQLQAKYPWMKW